MRLEDVNLRVAISPVCNLNCLYCGEPGGYQVGKYEDFRRDHRKAGNIGIENLLEIVRLFHQQGIIGLTLTGGEPLLNKNWDRIVNDISRIGMSRVEMTTNGILLSDYLEGKETLPQGLTLVKISLDTTDPGRFAKITGGGDIRKVFAAAKKINPYIRTRANKVLLRNDLGDLADYFEACHNLGFREVSLLDLIIYTNRDNAAEKDFFEREYISFKELKEYLSKTLKIDFSDTHKYGHSFTWSNGLKVIIKDSHLAVRAPRCLNCPVYCQEGIYAIRIGTDGNITMCPDYQAELPSVNGILELERGTLSERISEMITTIRYAKEIKPFTEYLRRHQLAVRNGAP